MPAEDQPPATVARRILLVEDDKTTLLVLTQLVQTAGYIVVTAADSAEAIRVFELESPDLMLVDINLRGENVGQPMDGLGLIDWLKYRHPDHAFKYIIVSGDDLRMHETRAAATGAFSFVRKPIDPDRMLFEIRRAVGDLLDAEQAAATNPEPQ